MPKSFVIISIVVIGLIAIIKLNAIDAIFWLLFAGAIPGTNISIPPTILFISYLIIGVLLVRWAFKNDLYIGSPTVKANKNSAFSHKQAPAKRRRTTTARKSTAKRSSSRRRTATAKAHN